MHSFSVFLDDRLYGTHFTVSETVALLTALGATGRVMAELEGE